MSRTRILVDARSLGPAEDDGADRMLVGLLRALPGALAPAEELLVLAQPAAAVRVCSLIDAEVVPCPVATASFRQHAGLARWLDDRRLDVDVYHYPQFDLPLLPRQIATTACVYDLTPLEVPGYFGRGRGLRAFASALLYASTFARADAVVVISEATAAGCRRYMPAARHDRIHVAMPGPSPGVGARAARSSEPPGPRFVYVGNHRPHKQVPLLIRAFAKVRERVEGAELILIGRPDPRFPEVPELLEGPLGQSVSLRTGLDDHALAALLSSARALVFPSIGEGFGFPVIEAYALGVPAIVANAAALPEAAGDAGVLVDPPGSERAWVDAMVSLAHDDDEWRELARRTAGALARFSWDKHAAEVTAAWRAALRGRTSP